MTPPAWRLWLCVAWCALTALGCGLVFVVVAWQSRRFKGMDLSKFSSSRDSAEGDSLLGTLDEDDHINRSHG